MYKIFVGVSLLLLLAGCGRTDGDDLILLQNGSHLTGTLQGCLDGACQFNGRQIPQATIAWIGLHQTRLNPPQPNDPAVGEIRLTDHSVHPGLMTSIDPTRVAAASASYDRPKVLWVYLAHPVNAASGDSGTASDMLTEGGRVVHYDVDIAVTAHQHIQNRIGTGASIEDDSVDWTGSWRNVALRIVPNPDGTPNSVLGDGPFPTGGMQASAKFTYNDPPNIHRPTNCKGELPTQTYTGGINLLVYLNLGGTTNKISFHAGAQDSGMAFYAAVRAVVKARCHPNDFSVTALTDGFPFRTPDGIDIALNILVLDWERASASASGIPFPLDQILAGKSFTLETGNRTRFSPVQGSGAESGDGQKVDEAVRVSFTAR